MDCLRFGFGQVPDSDPWFGGVCSFQFLASTRALTLLSMDELIVKVLRRGIPIQNNACVHVRFVEEPVVSLLNLRRLEPVRN